MRPQTVDLSHCDREPIHIPGSIQPHGVMLVAAPATLEIVRVSSNSDQLLGYRPEELLGKPLSDAIGTGPAEAIGQALNKDNFERINPLDIRIETESEPRKFDGIAHRSDGWAVVELEPRQTEETADPINFYQRVKGPIARIQQAAGVREMCEVAAEDVRKLTGFDRVMVYQFDRFGAGSVIAEDTDQEISYLGLHYPASDIPQQARQLYTVNWLRLIPDIRYQPAPLISANGAIAETPLDLSRAALRSVSPVHLEYLHNMGVGASLSVSLVQDRKLWGLIACHHRTPKFVPHSVRAACELIGRVASAELANKQAAEKNQYRIQVKSLQAELVAILSRAENFLDGIAQLDGKLLHLVGATGAIACGGNHCVQIGETPSKPQVKALLDWIGPQLERGVFECRSLPSKYPPAESFRAIASGVLVLEISSIHRKYIIWFRPEVIQTVNWAGNPNKPVEVQADGSFKLSPRKSFELWRETMRGCSEAWKPCQIEAAVELRSLIVGIVLRQSDELALMNRELQRSNEELDAFAYIASHDLKEPLRGIHNYANFLMEDYGHILDEAGVAKLETLVRLTRRMENLLNSLLHFSRLGRSELLKETVDLNELVQQAISTLTISRPESLIDFRIPRPLPKVQCDRAQVSELFTNLISNGIKYNDKAEKWIEIGYIEQKSAPADPKREQSRRQVARIFYVRDNGIGVGRSHLDKIFQIFRRLHGRDEFGGGTGAGLTIARKIAERHGGKIWVESAPGRGSTFYFTLSPD